MIKVVCYRFSNNKSLFKCIPHARLIRTLISSGVCRVLFQIPDSFLIHLFVFNNIRPRQIKTLINTKTNSKKPVGFLLIDRRWVNRIGFKIKSRSLGINHQNKSSSRPLPSLGPLFSFFCREFFNFTFVAIIHKVFKHVFCKNHT